MKKRTTVTACRLPDEHLAALKSLAAMRNVSMSTFLRVLIREFLNKRLIIPMP